jgi:hypothetical protein
MLRFLCDTRRLLPFVVGWQHPLGYTGCSEDLKLYRDALLAIMLGHDEIIHHSLRLFIKCGFSNEYTGNPSRIQISIRNSLLLLYMYFRETWS